MDIILYFVVLPGLKNFSKTQVDQQESRDPSAQDPTKLPGGADTEMRVLEDAMSVADNEAV